MIVVAVVCVCCVDGTRDGADCGGADDCVRVDVDIGVGDGVGVGVGTGAIVVDMSGVDVIDCMMGGGTNPDAQDPEPVVVKVMYAMDIACYIFILMVLTNTGCDRCCDIEQYIRTVLYCR